MKFGIKTDQIEQIECRCGKCGKSLGIVNKDEIGTSKHLFIISKECDCDKKQWYDKFIQLLKV